LALRRRYRPARTRDIEVPKQYFVDVQPCEPVTSSLSKNGATLQCDQFKILRSFLTVIEVAYLITKGELVPDCFDDRGEIELASVTPDGGHDHNLGPDLIFCDIFSNGLDFRN
jgi:hypothetical protein